MVCDLHLYEILSVSPSVSSEEISRAYKKLALKCHPDKTNHDPVLTEKFKEMTRAYEILKDPDLRKRYDDFGEVGLSGTKYSPPSPLSPPPPQHRYQHHQQPYRQYGRQRASATPHFSHPAYGVNDMFSKLFEDINVMFSRDAGVHFGNGPMPGLGPRLRRPCPMPQGFGVNHDSLLFDNVGPSNFFFERTLTRASLMPHTPQSLHINDPLGLVQCGPQSSNFNVPHGLIPNVRLRLNINVSQSHMPHNPFSASSEPQQRPQREAFVPAGPVPKKRGRDIHHLCRVDLADMYFGKNLRLVLPRTCKCRDCSGMGSRKSRMCQLCEGTGAVLRATIQPHAQRLEAVTCMLCDGKGILFPATEMCLTCDGSGYHEENKMLKVKILPGTKDGDKIIMERAGDEGRNLIPGDVIIQVKEAPHAHITRKDHDLHVLQAIDLRTALLGGSFNVHDYLRPGQMLKVYVNVHGQESVNNLINSKINQGQITGTITPGEPKIVKGLGMPINDSITNGIVPQETLGEDPFKLLRYPRGDLIVNFTVTIPSLEDFANREEDLKTLSKILRPVAPEELESRECVVEAFLRNASGSSTCQNTDDVGFSPSKPVEISGSESDDNTFCVPDSDEIEVDGLEWESANSQGHKRKKF